MKKIIVLICSLVLVFSLVIPISAQEPLHIQQAKELDYELVVVGYLGDQLKLFFIDTEDGSIPDYTCGSDAFNYCIYSYGTVGEYDYNNNLWVYGGSYYASPEECASFNFTGDYGYPLTDYVIIEKEAEQEPEGPEQPLTEIQLLERNNEVLTHIYTAILFSVSIAVVVLVVFLLYKFLRKFF